MKLFLNLIKNKIKSYIYRIFQMVIYSEIYQKIHKFYKIYINYELSLINIIKISIIAHLGLLVLNPFSSFYQSGYLLYENRKLSHEVSQLKLQIYLNEQTIKSMKSGSMDTYEELLLNQGKLVNPHAKLIILDESD